MERVAILILGADPVGVGKADSLYSIWNWVNGI